MTESEPELEALADELEPDAVTEDAAEFTPPGPDDEIPAGPGDAPVDVTIDDEPAVSPRAGHVEDDPYGGVPIEPTAGAPNPDEDGDTAVEEETAAEPTTVAGEGSEPENA